MPTHYKRKTPSVSQDRINRLAKILLDESAEDRNLALSAFEYFKSKAETADNEAAQIASSSSQKCMVDCLKLAQDARNKALKAFELIMKLSKDMKTKTPEEKKAEEFKFDDFS